MELYHSTQTNGIQTKKIKIKTKQLKRRIFGIGETHTPQVYIRLGETGQWLYHLIGLGR